MFLGSADNRTAEIRPTSFNGMIRYWFRALALAELDGDMKEVERLEDIIFGSAKDKNSHKALYSLKIANSNISIKENKNRLNKENRQGIVYLGYGVISYKREARGPIYERDYIKQGGSIEISLIQNEGIKNRVLEEDLKLAQKLLINTLKVLGIFGGLGSRTRRGFGSLTLIDLKNKDEPLVTSPYCGNVEALENEIKELLKKAVDFGKSIEDIKYTAFSKFTKVMITKEYDNPMKLLDEIGKEMIRYRSCGRGWKILDGEDSSKIFESDHNLIYEFSNTGKIKEHPKRVVFGLPHNYWLSNRKTVNINSDYRRASPLFIHVHKLANGKYIGILTLIPTKFLKDREKIKIIQYDNSRRKRTVEYEKTIKEVEVSYKYIEEYLDWVVNKLSGCVII